MGFSCSCSKAVPESVIDVNKLENGLLDIENNQKLSPRQVKGQINLFDAVSTIVEEKSEIDSKITKKSIGKGRICN